MFPPAVLALEASQKDTLIASQVASEASKVVMVKIWTSVWDAIRSTPVAFPPHLSGRTERETRVTASVRDRLSLTREGKLQCKVCLHPHLGHGGMPPVERWHWLLIFSLTDSS